MLPRESRRTSSAPTLVWGRDYAGSMATCFCGCGRQIEGIRRGANNKIAAHMYQDLAVMHGAIERGEAGPLTAQTRSMADEGVLLLEMITRYLHGEVQRDQVDRGMIKKWNKRASRLADSLVETATGPAWEPDDPRTDGLGHSGQRVKGVVTDVRREGWGNDRVASLRMSVLVRTVDGAEIALERALSISVVKAPRVGDSVEVAYDPADPNRFVYRPLVEMPGAVPPAEV
jgi:hypothetical protein